MTIVTGNAHSSLGEILSPKPSAVSDCPDSCREGKPRKKTAKYILLNTKIMRNLVINIKPKQTYGGFQHLPCCAILPINCQLKAR